MAESELVWAQQQLERGADLGVKGAGCLPTAGPNAELARTYGHLLSDALARWVQLELVCGPYEKDELPWVSMREGVLSTGYLFDCESRPIILAAKTVLQVEVLSVLKHKYFSYFSFMVTLEPNLGILWSNID